MLPATQAEKLMPGSKVALIGGKDKKYCADEGSRIRCNRNRVGGWEKFTVENARSGKIALRGGKRGKLCADEGSRIKCNRNRVGGWEKFTVVDAGSGKIALKVRCFVMEALLVALILTVLVVFIVLGSFG